MYNVCDATIVEGIKRIKGISRSREAFTLVTVTSVAKHLLVTSVILLQRTGVDFRSKGVHLVHQSEVVSSEVLQVQHRVLNEGMVVDFDEPFNFVTVPGSG